MEEKRDKRESSEVVRFMILAPDIKVVIHSLTFAIRSVPKCHGGKKPFQGLQRLFEQE